MAALPPTAPIEPSLQAQPMQIDAFQSVLNAAGAALSANPEAIGQTLLSGVEGFRSRETEFHSVVEQAINGSATQTDSVTSTGSAISAEIPQRGLTAAEALQKGEALQRQSMGVMMQTYSFALEATLVTNAATTFTSSINTLIKTQ
jgi:hypothetical protein